jgi:hypothetical protein
MFIIPLFTIAKSWKQLRWPSVGQWVNKLWHMQKIKYYFALKWNELLSNENTWRNLKCIWQVKDAHLRMLHSICSNYMTFWKRQHYGDIKKITSCHGWQRREGWIGRTQNIFRTMTLYVTIMVGMWHYTFVKPTEYLLQTLDDNNM